MIHKLNLCDPLVGSNIDNLGVWYTWYNFQQGRNMIYWNKDLFKFVRSPGRNLVKVVPYTFLDHHSIIIYISHEDVSSCIRTKYESFALSKNLLEYKEVLNVAFIIKQIKSWSYMDQSTIDTWN